MKTLENIYPVLQALPKKILLGLDLNVLAIPSAAEKKLIDTLSERLQEYVVVYKTIHRPEGGHLCRTIKSADLHPSQLNMVAEAEKELAPEHNIIVVYEKPLQRF